MGKRIKDSKEQFKSVLIEDEVLKDMEIFDVLKEKYNEFYDICEKYVDIPLNAQKSRVPGSCDIQGCFLFKDIDKAKLAAKVFFDNNSLENIDEYMLAIKRMYRFAVDFNDSRCLGGVVKTENDNSKNILFGKYYNFSEIPSDIWENIENRTKEFILGVIED